MPFAVPPRCRLCQWAAALAVAAVVGAGAAACSSDDVPVEAGRFEATVGGALVDTLRGKARYRVEDGRLVGIELSAGTDRGLSMEMNPRDTLDAPPRLYDVVGWSVLGRRTEGPPGVAAFLTMPQGQFQARRGTLEVDRRTEGRVAGRFEMVMQGTFDDVPAEVPSVTVQGVWHAHPERAGEGPAR
jgi:hypothetical protein